MSLFRSEATAARERAWLGRIVLARPLPFTVLTAAALGIAVSLAAFFLFGDYTRKTRVAGTLAPTQGVVRVIAPQPGRIEALAVEEGAQVERDAPLLVLGDGRATPLGHDIGRAVAARMDERRRWLARSRSLVLETARAEAHGLEQRRTALSREAEHVGVELEAQSRRVALARQALARFERLKLEGFLSPAARDREADALLEQELRVESLRRTRLALSREMASLGHEIAASLARTGAQVAGIDAQLAAVDQEHAERVLQYRATVVAPASGIVAAVLVEPGQMVLPGTTLATLIPVGGTLEAHLFTTSRAIGFVRPGQEVLLRYLAYPYQKFGSHRARIVSVSRNPLPPAELGFAPGDGGREPLYRIKAELPAQSISAYGRPEPLQAGMQLEADILLDRRRLIEWVFEPLFSLAGRT